MKRNIKAILSAAAAAMMVLSMAGCGSSASGSASSAASTLRTSGLSARTAWSPGNASITCFRISR